MQLDCPLLLWNEPGAQAVQDAAPLPLYVPAAHMEHADCPVDPWNVPGEHGVHAVWRLPLLYEPAGQALQLDCPL